MQELNAIGSWAPLPKGQLYPAVTIGVRYRRIRRDLTAVSTRNKGIHGRLTNAREKVSFKVGRARSYLALSGQLSFTYVRTQPRIWTHHRGDTIKKVSCPHR